MQSTLNKYFPATKSGVARPSKDVSHMGSATATAHVDDQQTNPFDLLPIEMNQRIAEALPDERSIYAFMRTCRSARDAIEADGRSFWRRRFLATFDKPERSKSNTEYKAAYLDRSLFNFRMVTFSSGNSPEEQRCLKAIRDIILESFSDAPEDTEPSRRTYKSGNMAHLREIIKACPSLLDSIFDPSTTRPQRRRNGGPSKPNALLQTIQVMLAPKLLHLYSDPTVKGFDDSQRAAYAFKPLFKGYHGLDINMEWLLHQINFWRYHMLREGEGVLTQAYCDLDRSEYPRYWESQLDNNKSVPAIGRFWKGSYGFLEEEEILQVREGKADWIQDSFCGEGYDGNFQDLELKLLQQGEETWPAVFEEHLQALEEPKKRANTRAQRGSAQPDQLTWESRSFRFDGFGDDQKEGFQADGWLNTLPSQSGIPGWQRMTMMKYFRDDAGNVDYSNLWAYEGVVLPGGKIILGRWWSPYDGDMETIYSGPFILWCIDTPELLMQRKKEDSPEL